MDKDPDLKTAQKMLSAWDNPATLVRRLIVLMRHTAANTRDEWAESYLRNRIKQIADGPSLIDRHRANTDGISETKTANTDDSDRGFGADNDLNRSGAVTEAVRRLVRKTRRTNPYEAGVKDELPTAQKEVD